MTKKRIIDDPEDLKALFRECLNINDETGSVRSDIKQLFDAGIPESNITRLAGAALLAGMYGDDFNRSVMQQVTAVTTHIFSDYIKKNYIQLLTDTLIEIVHEVYEIERKRK